MRESACPLELEATGSVTGARGVCASHLAEIQLGYPCGAAAQDPDLSARRGQLDHAGLYGTRMQQSVKSEPTEPQAQYSQGSSAYTGRAPLLPNPIPAFTPSFFWGDYWGELLIEHSHQTYQ